MTKLNAVGSQLLYSTYLGGSYDDYGYAIAINGADEAFVVGDTPSMDFPTASPIQATHGDVDIDRRGSHPQDAFVSRLDKTGSALLFSTYLGGSNDDYAYAIAVDAAGDACVAGETRSKNFPYVGTPQPSFGGVTDAWVAKLSQGGGGLSGAPVPALPGRVTLAFAGMLAGTGLFLLKRRPSYSGRGRRSGRQREH